VIGLSRGAWCPRGLLLEDAGVGKTNLAKSLATSIECSFGRVQFTRTCCLGRGGAHGVEPG
jgi:AAA+ superfamily predicted ATPase